MPLIDYTLMPIIFRVHAHHILFTFSNESDYLQFTLFFIQIPIFGNQIINMHISNIQLTNINYQLYYQTMHSSQPSDSTARKRIVISIDKSNKKSKPTHDAQFQSSFNPNKQLPKLLEISERCFDYYNKFKDDRLQQQQYTEAVFAEILNFLSATFKELHESITAKEQQIKNSIFQKKKQFLSFHPLHFLSLTSKIEAIKEHKNTYEQIISISSPSMFDSKLNAKVQLKENQISEFAQVLNQFYAQIQTIERVNYRQNIRESINFLRNLIADESSIYNNCTINNANQTINGNISFNNEQLFSVKQFLEEPSQCLWEEFKLNTEKQQRDRDRKIEKYAARVKVL